MAVSAALPTLYEYYTAGGITSGLSVDQPHFTLNDKNITLYSGAMHYFRIPRQYWRDRLKKLRAAGLNTVETYVPWNLHEPENGVFDFGDGGSDMQQFLDVQEYLRIAQEEDLFAIVRPGPYICAEWEWGGLPSWLLKEDGMKVRTSESKYMNYVKRYFSMLLPLLAVLQFTSGGPIIAFQVENEYGSSPQKDLDYIQQLHQTMREYGIKELLVTSDGASSGTSGTLPELLFQTVNFGSDPNYAFDLLKDMQPNKPIMAMEYWTGWFDHWSETHHTVSNDTFHGIYEAILKYPASVNMYMFHGGTNWGFLNGANIGSGDNSNYQPTTTSYDYDAPLSEAGDYTDKYYIVRDLIKQYNTIETLTPDLPLLVERKAYPSVTIDSQLNFNVIMGQAPNVIPDSSPLPMEKLPINNGSGQSYGYIVYQKDNLNIAANSVLTITGHIRDTVMVVINGVLISKPLASSDDLNDFGYWRLENSNITLTSTDLVNATLDLIFENWGRGNFGNLYYQYKGLTEDNQVYLNDEELLSWTIYPFDFKKAWMTSLVGWTPFDGDLKTGPAIYRGTLSIDPSGADPTDTFINMQEWTKGLVIVNGFILGRYASIGPQQTLYLPGAFLQKGDNDIIIALPTLYEHYTVGGITSGLSVDQPQFTLNDKNITLYSGAMHYFRILRQYWRDQTYVPWNFHEPENGVFDFGDGGSNKQQFLDVQEYLRIAQEEDSLGIVRPGPYICAEWE
ncbi:beta-galactosidase-1-like protein 2 [Asbolus verrucosus]|uniref:Beta-galactosidase n=1 Tax=Asbolus verrucosus TaxID=1661398 RepID=A0A482W9N9_ASBVE|nr:beta-galactosidase-1-like protein 2 [Asbolus verrucosus]